MAGKMCRVTLLIQGPSHGLEFNVTVVRSRPWPFGPSGSLLDFTHRAEWVGLFQRASPCL